MLVRRVSTSEEIFDFWKRIGTPSFILNVIETEYLLPFVSFPEPAVFKTTDRLSHMPSLLQRLFET